MKNRKLIFVAFALVILAVPIFILINSERIIADGEKYKLHLRGYDPIDPFRGRYIRLNFEEPLYCDEELKSGGKAYITLEKDSLGFSYFHSAKSTRPDNSNYFEAKMEKWGNCNVDLNNIEKYFINEDKASKAELIVQDYTRKKPNDIWVEVSVLDGEMRMVDVFIEGTPLLEFLEESE